jgi:hypothetical protein
VDELDVDAVDRGDELRQRIEPGLDLAPVIARFPVANQRLQPGQLNALRGVADRLAVGPARGPEAPAQIGDRSLGNIDAEGPYLVALRCGASVRRGRRKGRGRRTCEKV